MTKAQLTIAIPLLNSYAHQYLGLSYDDVAVFGGEKGDCYFLIISTPLCARQAADFNEAKQIIDKMKP